MIANTWMRARGESIGTFALESAVDELASSTAEMGMEPQRRRSSTLPIALVCH
jgi:xanthine dehydrogenase YagR molybdenum-binding subunit